MNSEEGTDKGFFTCRSKKRLKWVFFTKVKYMESLKVGQKVVSLTRKHGKC